MEVSAFHIGRKVEEQTSKLPFVKEIPNKITVKLGYQRYPKTYENVKHAEPHPYCPGKVDNKYIYRVLSKLHS